MWHECGALVRGRGRSSGSGEDTGRGGADGGRKEGITRLDARVSSFTVLLKITCASHLGSLLNCFHKLPLKRQLPCTFLTILE